MNFIHRIMFWSSRHPVATLTLIVLVSLGAIIPASRIQIVTSIDNLMMRNDPERELYLETRELFGSEARALIYIEDPKLFSPEKLEALQLLVFDLEMVDGISGTESLFSVTDIENIDGQLDIHALIEQPPQTHEEAETLRERALHHPVVQKLLLSPDATVTAINLRLDLENGYANRMQELCDGIEGIIVQHASHFKRVEQLGRPYIITAEKEYILRDQQLILPLALIILAITLLIVLSSFKSAFLPLLTSGTSILWTLAFMRLCNLGITELSFMIPAILIVVGSTEDIHLLAEYRSGRQEKLTCQKAVNRMITRLATAVMFTAVTTFAGFFSIIAAPMPVLREFGIAASFGLLINPLITITLIPACLILMPDRSHAMQPTTHPAWRLETFILKILSRQRRYPVISLLAIGLPCIAAGIYGAIYVKADNNIVGFFKPNSPVVQRLDRLHDNLSGGETFYIRIDAQPPDTFKQPEHLQYAIDLQNYLEQAGWIDRTVCITDYLSYLHHSITGADVGTIPDRSEGVAEYLLLLHRSEIEPHLSADAHQLSIIVRHNIRSSRELTPYIEALRNHIEQTCPPTLTTHVTGEMLLVNKAVNCIINGQLRGILLVSFVATILLSILFRSIRIGSIALIPNLLPIGVQFGFMAAAGIPLNTATSMAAAISIGLAVDDTIHLLMRFYAQDPNLPAAEAVDHALSHLLRPIVATSVSLSLGFLILRASNFIPIADFGLLAAVVLMTALVADLICTPTLLSLRIMHPARKTVRKEIS